MSVPPTPAQRDAAIAMGAQLRAAIRTAGLTITAVAARADISLRHLEKILAGQTRTRRSTLERIANAISTENPAGGTAGELLDALTTTAGSALAGESRYALEDELRRIRRRAQAAREVERERIDRALINRALALPDLMHSRPTPRPHGPEALTLEDR